MNLPELVQGIYNSQPWEEKLTEPLTSLGFDKPAQAWKNLATLAGQAKFPTLHPDFFPTLLELISQSYQADTALLNFERFTEKILDKNYLYTLLSESSSLLKALITLFSGSQVLTDTLLNDPSHFDWLKNPDTLGKSKSRDVLMRDFFEMAGEDYLSQKTPSLLRRFKKREYIRIGLRDLLGGVELEETVHDLSILADVCLQVAYEYADKVCKEKYGIPVYKSGENAEKESEFAILAMGKLGGLELNFSSDIDLIYIYTSSNGETRPDESAAGSKIRVSNHEYFTKLAQLVTKTINEITSEGNVFRVDLDLRPEGKSGEIAHSLRSCEVYYESWGRTWERQAMLKARISAGSVALGRKFFSLMEPFIYRRSLDFSAIEEIKSMKEKINQSLKGKKTGKGNIKLGFGGIREIEFFAQSYQLLFGGRDKNLRVRNTLKLLNRLMETGFLSKEDYCGLKEAYIFLRNLENRVQISYGLQTHILPEEETQRIILARKMRLGEGSGKELAQRLMDEFKKHTEFVGGLFAGLLAEEKKQEAAKIASVKQVGGQTGLSLEDLKKRSFSHPQRAFRFLKSLRDGPKFSHPSEKSINDFYMILPQILDQCERAPKPNSAVENLVRFIEAGGVRESYLSFFKGNNKFLELLLILFGSSGFLSQILIKQPGLVDVLMDLESIYRFRSPKKIADDLGRNLKSFPNLQGKTVVLCRAKQAEELRIGVRYLIGETDLVGTLTDLSNLADSFLQTAYRLACEELNKKAGVSSPLPDDFAIFGLGKLGGRELNFGSDLDIIFVYEEPPAEKISLRPEEIVVHYVGMSQMIYQISSEMNPAGYAYKIDTDLRPEGKGGVLVLSVKGYEDYFKNRARIWEQQAMTRARFVAGKPEVGDKFLKIADDFTYPHKLEYGSLIEISRLRERMEKELAQETAKGKNIKLGYGGLADIEFTLQILQLMHGKRNPKLRHTNMLESLNLFSAYGLVDQNQADQIQKNYLFLRNLECGLRIVDQKSANHLPSDDESMAVLAKLLGYTEKNKSDLAAKIRADYEETTGQVREFYTKTLDHLLRTSL